MSIEMKPIEPGTANWGALLANQITFLFRCVIALTACVLALTFGLLWVILR